MNYFAGLLAIALLGALLTASLYRSDAISWHGKYDGLVTSYNQAADKAREDAEKKEAQDLADLKKQSGNAISEAAAATSQANAARAAYLKKLAGLKPTDCANQLIPADLVPK